MASISSLPTELLEMIFYNFDGSSFARAMRVCKKWHCVTNSMKNCWKDSCIKEIDDCVIEELLGYRSKTDIAKNHPIWKSIYAKWYRGRMVSKDCVWTKTFAAPEDNPITQVKISGSFVLTGHRSGSVFAWDQLTGQRKRCLVQHLLMVVDFVLVDILYSGPYGTSDEEWDHHHIISVSKDPTVQVNSLLYQSIIDDDLDIVAYHSCGFMSIKVFDNKVAIAGTNNSIRIFNMEYVREPRHRLVLTLCHQITGPSQLLQNFQFWKNELQCCCLNGNQNFYNHETRNWITVAPQYLVRTRSRTRQVKRNSIRSSFIFRKETIMLVTTSTILVSIDGRNYAGCNMFENLSMQVVCLTLYGSILAIGTISGHLLLYHVPKEEKFISARNLRPNLSRYLDEASIVAINISDNGESPVIAACTTNRIFILKWHSIFHNSTISQDVDATMLKSSVEEIES